MAFLDILVSLVILVLMEVILGIDNLVFLTILTEKLPAQQRKRARHIGLTLAWVLRLLALSLAMWLVKLNAPIIWTFSIRDLFLLAGGAFLIGKATQEIHMEVGEAGEYVAQKTVRGQFKTVVLQVALMDIIFSLDSILTAIGLTTHFWVMAFAITFAILIMIYASEPLAAFISKYPTIKMLALSFLILIGMVLIADAFSFHIPRAYIYFSMGFSLAVESLNLIKRTRKKTQK